MTSGYDFQVPGFRMLAILSAWSRHNGVHQRVYQHETERHMIDSQHHAQLAHYRPHEVMSEVIVHSKCRSHVIKLVLAMSTHNSVSDPANTKQCRIKQFYYLRCNLKIRIQ